MASKTMTREAAARLSPRPPALVEIRKRRSLYWLLLKVSTMSLRFSALVCCK